MIVENHRSEISICPILATAVRSTFLIFMTGVTRPFTFSPMAPTATGKAVAYVLPFRHQPSVKATFRPFLVKSRSSIHSQGSPFLITKFHPAASIQFPRIFRTWLIQTPTRRGSATSVSPTISTRIPATSTTLITTQSGWIRKSPTTTPCLPALL